MTKKLIKHGKDLALVIDKPTLEKLGITEKTVLDVEVMGDILVVKSKNVSKDKHIAALEKSATSIMDKYEPVFKKLAKT
jgi:antitoxin component of MazEF toxin-antitoxin module